MSSRSAERFEIVRSTPSGTVFVRDVLPGYADGRIVPVIDKVFPFSELPAAKAYVETNAQLGKVVVRVA